MEKRLFIGFMLLIGILLVACSQTQSTLPTLASTVNEASEIPPTEAPTEEAPTSTAFVRPTLPSTFTPTVTLSPSPSPLPATLTPVPTLVQLASACDVFAIDRLQSAREFVIGSEPAVFWTAVEGVQFYRVVLTDQGGFESFTDITEVTSYAFSSDQFELGQRYGWEVRPINADGEQFCYGLGAELIPTIQ